MAEVGRTAGARGSGRVRTAVVWDVLRRALDQIAKESGRSELDVVDAGGGTGGFAVPLAELGHRVTVVDASPDALAALERRAAERGVRVRALQGDADALLGAVGEDVVDLVLCHSVLEYVDDPAAAMRSIAAAVRPGGSVSVLTSGRLAAVLHRAIAGDFADAHAVLTGTTGTRRGFDRAGLAALAEGAGLVPRDLHGVRIFADLVPSAQIDAEPSTADALIELETAAATHPVLADLATQLHLLASKPVP